MLVDAWISGRSDPGLDACGCLDKRIRRCFRRQRHVAARVKLQDCFNSAVCPENDRHPCSPFAPQRDESLAKGVAPHAGRTTCKRTPLDRTQRYAGAARAPPYCTIHHVPVGKTTLRTSAFTSSKDLRYACRQARRACAATRIALGVTAEKAGLRVPGGYAGAGAAAELRAA